MIPHRRPAAIPFSPPLRPLASASACTRTLTDRQKSPRVGPAHLGLRTSPPPPAPNGIVYARGVVIGGVLRALGCRRGGNGDRIGCCVGCGLGHRPIIPAPGTPDRPCSIGSLRRRSELEAGTKKRASLHVVEGIRALSELDPGELEIFSATKAFFREVLGKDWPRTILELEKRRLGLT